LCRKITLPSGGDNSNALIYLKNSLFEMSYPLSKQLNKPPLLYANIYIYTNVSKIELMNLLHENPCFAGVRRNDYESEI